MNKAVKEEQNLVEGPFIVQQKFIKNVSLYSKTGHWSEKENVKYYAFLKKYR